MAALLLWAMLPLAPLPAVAAATPEHLVISEVVTGGASASDELIEIYNPTGLALPLEGLELVYVSASGLTVSRRASWDAGAPALEAGRHLLVANELGAYVSIADAVYGSGMAPAGGSVALRIQGASSAIDALGWGTAASIWLEGTPAAAPAAGASLERLPGGALGSTQDSGVNTADFVERAVPDPQNLDAPAVPASVPPSVTPTPVPLPTPTPTPVPTSAPALATPIADARQLVDGSAVTVVGTALTSSDFHDGGGYLSDASGGIAVLVSDGGFARGASLRITGTVDDRFAQRTLRAEAEDVTVLGSGDAPAAVSTPTGSIGEALEARLVRVAGRVTGAPSQLSGGLAYELDDGSGPIRVIVGTASGIDTSGWSRDATVELVGVVGQRDSSGTGASGYRVQPRDAADIVGVGEPAPSASASASPPSSPTSSPGPSASAPVPDGSVIGIATARALPKGATVRVRGVVTLPSGAVDAATAVIQDETGGIVLRLGEEAGALARGERVEAAGVRSTLAGMETIRVSAPPELLGSAGDPAPRTLRTGDAGEADEARLVLVRGEVVASARTASSGTVSFELDDGSGPLRVSLGAPLEADGSAWTAGTKVEVTGVLGQETSGTQPLAGYRVWPRAASEVRLIAPATNGEDTGEDGDLPGGAGGDGGGASPGGGAAPGGAADLDGVDGGDLSQLRIGATLVSGPWPELGIGGLLWDGARLVAVSEASGPRFESLAPPLAVELTGLALAGTESTTGLTIVALPDASDALVIGPGMVAPPVATLPGAGDAARWVTLVGQLVAGPPWASLQVGGRRIVLDLRCADPQPSHGGAVSVTGIGLADPGRIVVPCDGIRKAPTFVTRGDAATSPGAPGEEHPTAPATDRASGQGPADRRPLAALLLGSGVLILVGGVVARRRFAPDDDDDPAAGVGDQEEPMAPSAPQLTLVALPHERGSP